MPVNETLELRDALRDRLGHDISLVVANGLAPDRFSDEEADAARGARRARRLAGGLGAVGPPPRARAGRAARAPARGTRRRAARAAAVLRGRSPGGRGAGRPRGASAVNALAGKRVVVCAGAGGVGKTTTAAALALGLAAEGARVAVVTIDPAKRLANALGLHALRERARARRRRAAGRPRHRRRGRAVGDDARSQADLRRPHRPPGARREARARRCSPTASTSRSPDAVAGSQEYTAMAKLYELDRDGGFDVIVLDTPPSPQRAGLPRRARPADRLPRGQARCGCSWPPPGWRPAIVGRGTSVVFAALKRVTGVELLEDLSTFFGSLGGPAGRLPRARRRASRRCSPTRPRRS